MRIQYCSDLHLEFPENSAYLKATPLRVSGDILIVAGDLIPLHDEFFNHPFFRFATDNYEQVYWVPGNHEFYYKDISKYADSYDIKLKENFRIVNNIVSEINGVRFIFSTLWSFIGKMRERLIEESVSDFGCISVKNRKFKATDFNKLHSQCLEFIKGELNRESKCNVVVTHHLPSSLCNAPVHANSPINEAFCVNLTDYIKTCSANFWIYGHSHYNQKALYLGKTLLLTNQLGYVRNNEHKQFRHNAYFAV